MPKQAIKWNILLDEIPGPFKNKFAVVTLIFIFWMLFFDRNSVIEQYKLQSTLDKLKAKQVYYEREIAKIEKDDKELFTNDAKKEKFVREHYFMKKADEDVFIIE